MNIDGSTAVLVHLAYPAAHLRTPQRFNPRCAERGVNAVLVPWQVRPEDLSATMQALRKAESLVGAIVTIPHKEKAARLCDRLDGVAAILEVANVIRRDADGTLTGRILDGDGFIGGLHARDVAIQGRSALIVGAGGVALAIAAALIEAGIARLRVANRTQARAEAMIARLRQFADGLGLTVALEVGAADPLGCDIAVNATSLGMHEDDALPMQIEKLGPGMTVAEVIMVPKITPLLREAEARGAVIVPGDAMIAGQIDPFIDFVLGPAASGTTGNTA
ncbi:MAG: shikimate dehydrogenase [Nitratireductor rhodophyticola]|uniref:shikimate dehydrogenase family protein n=1 Tax=Nitratireductor rhodophyticola TaxID=2854036 RepID=UPI0032D9315B